MQVETKGEGPCVVGVAWGQQENGGVPLCLLPALPKPKCVFQLRLGGSLQRTDDYLSGWVGVAEGFKKYPVWSCGKAFIPVKNKSTLSISSQRRVSGTSAAHLMCLWHVWGGAGDGGFFVTLINCFKKKKKKMAQWLCRQTGKWSFNEEHVLGNFSLQQPLLS